MTMGKKAIQRLLEWGAFTDERRKLVVHDEQSSIIADIAAADKLSCAIDRIRLEPRQPASLTADQLKAWGTRVGKRVRYLLEAIETVEVDQAQGRLLVRSTPPEKRADGSVLYYELLLESTGNLSLGRFRYEPNERQRVAEPMHCTHELVEKLIDDLLAARS